MEPTAPDARPNDVHADIPALHDLAASQSRHAGELHDVATRLVANAPPPHAFGPVGARFLAALCEAVARDAHAARQLAARLADASSTATSTAAAYDAADLRVGRAVGSVGV